MQGITMTANKIIELTTTLLTPSSVQLYRQRTALMELGALLIDTDNQAVDGLRNIAIECGDGKEWTNRRTAVKLKSQMPYGIAIGPFKLGIVANVMPGWLAGTPIVSTKPSKDKDQIPLSIKRGVGGVMMAREIAFYKALLSKPMHYSPADYMAGLSKRLDAKLLDLVENLLYTVTMLRESELEARVTGNSKTANLIAKRLYQSPMGALYTLLCILDMTSAREFKSYICFTKTIDIPAWLDQTIADEDRAGLYEGLFALLNKLYIKLI
jgi:hypothetical protein